MNHKKEISVCRYLIKRLKLEYGADCEGSDLDDCPEMYKNPKDVFSSSRCPSCRAREIIEFLERHIELLK